MEYIKCIKGNFVLTRNYRDAFNLDKFIDKYFEEYFDKYAYLVGDISSGILRLKGFDENQHSPNYCGNIDNYIETSCAFGCPFYVLKRVKDEDEYQKYVKNHHDRDEESKYRIPTIEKENFDKESLILETSEHVKPNINIDPERIGKLPKGVLPSDLVEKDTEYNSKTNITKPAPEPTQTYVSASPDFDPSKKKPVSYNNFNKHKHKNKKNNNNKKKAE